MEEFLKLALLLFLPAYIGAVYLWRIYVVRLETRVWPITYGGTNNLHDKVGKLFALLIALSIGNTMAYLFSPTLYQYCFPLRWMEWIGIQIAGVLLAWGSMLWTIHAQRHMGSAWRMGIDVKTKTSLVTDGPFRRSRHPIYLGVIVTALGLAMALPNALSLVIFAATVQAMSIQARLEEEHLSRVHGEPYLAYLKRTRRWI